MNEVQAIPTSVHPTPSEKVKDRAFPCTSANKSPQYMGKLSKVIHGKWA